MAKLWVFFSAICLITCVFAIEKSIIINGTPQPNLQSNKCYHVKKAPLYDIANNSGGVLHLYTVPGCHGPSSTMASSKSKKYGHLVSYKFI